MPPEPIRVLFVCMENACRSQIAEAFARHYGGPRLEAYSAGSRPRGSVDATAIAVMHEKGLDLSAQTSKGLAALPPQVWDALVTMGCGEACPHLPAQRRMDWTISDPGGQPLAVYRHVREAIDQAVQRLVNELTAHAVRR